MKLNRQEKIWLLLIIGIYIIYWLPFTPSYNNEAGAIIHDLVCLIPMWIIVYTGLIKMCKSQKAKNVSLYEAKNVSLYEAKNERRSTAC